MPSNEIAGANAGWCSQFTGKSQVVLSSRPGVVYLYVRLKNFFTALRPSRHIK
jgi:hypothetical protein